MAGRTEGDESWGFWFRHHWLRYGFGTLCLFADAMAVGEVLQLSPKPIPWYVPFGLVAMLAGLGALEGLLYLRLFPRRFRDDYNPGLR